MNKGLAEGSGLIDSKMAHCSLFFFFQAEDGIRDKLVTGVQTCALPICGAAELAVLFDAPPKGEVTLVLGARNERQPELPDTALLSELAAAMGAKRAATLRSEERRVGEECRSRWSPDHLKKKESDYGVAG